MLQLLSGFCADATELTRQLARAKHPIVTVLEIFLITLLV